MPYLIGTDEAGYGPNLGPLLIAATVWHLPDENSLQNLYEVLQDSVSASGKHPDRLWIADSKEVYSGGKGFEHLERAVWSAIACAGHQATHPLPHDIPSLWQALDRSAADHSQQAPWPVWAGKLDSSDHAQQARDHQASRLSSNLKSSGVTLERVRAITLYPSRFNELLELWGNKGEVLSRSTLLLIEELIETLPAEPIYIFCDKHGGRNRYAGLLQEVLTPDFVEVRHESRAESCYAFGPSNRRVEIRFAVGSERHLPVAWASMTAKYLRELSMQAFNAFWCGKIPGLKPTAGYPVDAKRFQAEIADLQATLGISADQMWRKR